MELCSKLLLLVVYTYPDIMRGQLSDITMAARSNEIEFLNMFPSIKVHQNKMNKASLTLCPVFFCSISFRMHGGCTARGSTVCRLAKETSFCYSQPRFLFTCCVLHLERFEVRRCKLRC